MYTWFSGSFHPYSETVVNKFLPSSSNPPIDTSTIDHLRQGVELRNSTDFFRSMQPKIWAGSITKSGTLDHQVSIQTYGQCSGYVEFFGDSTFEEKPGFNPSQYIQLGQDYPFPVTFNWGPQQQFEAIIEPLTIPSRLPSNEDLKDLAHGVSGQWQEGNPTDGRILGSSVITQFIPYTSSSQPNYFLDQGEYRFGSSFDGSIVYPGFRSRTRRTIAPFEDRNKNTLILRQLSGFRASHAALSGALMSMSFDDGDIRPTKHRSAVAGQITYGHNMARYGTDSITFAGTTNGSRRPTEAGSRLRMLPPKNNAKYRDSITGSFPTKFRTSNDNRTGLYPTPPFDDANVIEFAPQSILPGVGLPRGVSGSRFITPEMNISMSLIFPVNGTNSSETVKPSPTVIDPFIVLVKRGQELSPFVEDRLYTSDSGSIPKNKDFYMTGSLISHIGLGFSQPLSSKTKIEIDISPITSSIFGTQNGAGEDTPMVYFDFMQRRFLPVGSPQRRDQMSNDMEYFEKKAIGFAPSDIHNSLYPSAERFMLGAVTSNFCFPFDKRYIANSGSLFSLSGSINAPFLVEKIVLDFSASWHRSRPINFLEGGVAVSTFFIIRQEAAGKYDGFVKNILASNIVGTSSYQVSETTGSRRELIGACQISVQPELNDYVEGSRDLNISADFNYNTPSWSGRFIASASISAPVKTDCQGEFIFFTSDDRWISRNEYGGRTSVFEPCSRNHRVLVGTYQPSVEPPTPFFGAFFQKSSERFQISPYILLPTDTIICGWQSPVAVELIAFQRSKMEIPAAYAKVILYGSYLKVGADGNYEEYHDTMNQHLTSVNIHEVIG